MRTMITALTLSLLLATPAAFAAKKGGISLPDSQKVAGDSLVLNGIGIREATVFNVDVYVAGLYVKAKTKSAAAVIDAKNPKKILMHFVRDVEAGDITEAYTEGFKKNGGKSMAARVKKLNSWVVDMKEGDRMAIVYVPGKGTHLTVKGKKTASVAGDKFAEVLFKIFFGPNPPNSGLKDGMLGK
jgi:hypothetical protein